MGRFKACKESVLMAQCALAAVSGQFTEAELPKV